MMNELMEPENETFRVRLALFFDTSINNNQLCVSYSNAFTFPFSFLAQVCRLLSTMELMEPEKEAVQA